MNVTFSFELNTKYMKHLKDKSQYNRNFYEWDLSRYGDYITTEKCNILYEYFEEFSETYSYSLGYFEDGEFVNCFSWTEMSCKTNDYTGGY